MHACAPDTGSRERARGRTDTAPTTSMAQLSERRRHRYQYPVLSGSVPPPLCRTVIQVIMFNAQMIG